MIQIWGVLKIKQRIAMQHTVKAYSATQEDIHAAVDTICQKLDIPHPMWLNKHEGEMDRFGRTVFLPDNFIEKVNFERFEVEILKEKSKSRDPRNDFSYR